MTNSDPQLEQRIRDTVLRALRSPASASSTPLLMGSTPGWDSMGHMMVVMELEREFGVKFPPHLLPRLVDVASIANTLATGGQR